MFSDYRIVISISVPQKLPAEQTILHPGYLSIMQELAYPFTELTEWRDCCSFLTNTRTFKHGVKKV